jgi:hypothetical protein
VENRTIITTLKTLKNNEKCCNLALAFLEIILLKINKL